jgi:hypothetical protein
MTTVVQATCPGCRQRLYVPADWLTQAVRCKGCGLVLQARRPAAPPTTPAKPSGRTPPPPSQRVQTSAPPVPVAVPVDSSPFGFLAEAAPAPATAAARRRARRGSSGGWWKGAVLALAVVVTAAAVAYFSWPRLGAALSPKAAPSGTGPAVAAEPPRPDPAKDKDAPPAKDRPAEAPRPSDKDKPADPPKPGDKDKPSGKPSDKDKPAEAPKGQQPFPRRALVISVHNYLYANPVGAGMPGASARNLPNFLEALSRGLKIPMNQIAHLSDAAREKPRPPMKPVIEKTLADFLAACRAQDRVLVFFVGHAVEAGDEVYLVPIEGDVDNPDTLIPLQWVYGELAKCKARQKVLVLDTNRLNPGLGLERPNGGPMGAKTAAALAQPPAGVQVWAACSEGQQSYELESSPMGEFLDALQDAVVPDKNHKGLEGIQRPEDPLRLGPLCELVNANMKADLGPLKQTARVSGEEAADGAAYNKDEPPAPDAAKALAAAPMSAKPKDVQLVLDEVGLPPIKPTDRDAGLRTEALPPFDPAKMANYPVGGEETPLRKEVSKARALLWAVCSPSPPPPVLAEQVKMFRDDLKVNLMVMKDGYKVPANEADFKNKVVFKDEEQIAFPLGALLDEVKDLKAAGEKADDKGVKARDAETKRWQANYDYTLARLEAETAYVFEYQSALGRMRKELPPHDPKLHSGWKLASQVDLRGDSEGKKLAKAARALFEKEAADNAGTPWEVLAKREKLTALGMEWQAVR